MGKKTTKLWWRENFSHRHRSKGPLPKTLLVQEEGEEGGTANLDGCRRPRWIKGEWGWVGWGGISDDVKRDGKKLGDSETRTKRKVCC